MMTPRNQMESINRFGVVGDGVEVRPSSIAEAGMGLWTTRPYSKSELITEYSGQYLTHEQALELRNQDKDSHIRVVSSFHFCIDGIRDPLPGLGAASFANDARNSRINNAVFATRHDKKLGMDRVFLQAKWDIPAGLEMFVGYGNSYWRIRDLPLLVLQATNPMQAQATSASDSSQTSAHNLDSTNSFSVCSNSMCDSNPESDSDCADPQFLLDEHDAAARSDMASKSLSVRSISTTGSAHAPDIAASTDNMQKLPPLSSKQPLSPAGQQQQPSNAVSTLQDSTAGWESALAGFGRMSISDPEDNAAQHHASTQQQQQQQQIQASAAALAAAGTATAVTQNPPVSLWQDGMQTPPTSPNPYGASTGRPLSCRHDAPLWPGDTTMRRQQHSAPKPARPGSTARNLSACPILQGFPGVLAASAGSPAGAIASGSNSSFTAAEKAVQLLQASQAGDGCWSPPKARKHMRHSQQDLGQQQTPEGSARRPQRRRRIPDPQLQYNGTMQAAKPIDQWW